MAARKLTPKMLEALSAAATAEGVTHLPGFRSATLAALIDRGLLVVVAISGFKITEAGRSELRSVRRAASTTPPIAVGDTVEYAAAPNGPMTVTEVQDGRVQTDRGFSGDAAAFVKVEPTFVPTTIYPTDHALGAVTEVDNEFSTCEHGAAPDDCDACFNALADEYDPAAARVEQQAAGVRAPVVPAACCSLRTRGFDCGCADAAADRLTGFEPEDDADDLTLPTFAVNDAVRYVSEDAMAGPGGVVLRAVGETVRVRLASGLVLDGLREDFEHVEISCDASVHDGPGSEDGRECGEPADGTGRCADHPKAEHRAAAVESLVNAPTHTTVGEDLQEAFDKPTWHQHRLHGRVSGGTYLVLGSSIHKGHHVLWVQSEGSGGIFDPFRRPIPMTHASLRGSHCLVVACCEHRYTVTDTCPMCDALADQVADLVDRDTVPDREWPEVRAAAVKFIAERSVRAASTAPYPTGGVVRGGPMHPLRGGLIVDRDAQGNALLDRIPRTPEEESSERLQWTDEWESGDHYHAAGFAVCYSHKPCGQRYYVNEYRTLGGLVRAMLAHNCLCGR